MNFNEETNKQLATYTFTIEKLIEFISEFIAEENITKALATLLMIKSINNKIINKLNFENIELNNIHENAIKLMDELGKEVANMAKSLNKKDNRTQH